MWSQGHQSETICKVWPPCSWQNILQGVQIPFPLLTNTLKAYVPYPTDEQEQFAKFDLHAVDEIYCTNTKIYCTNTISTPDKYSYQPICTISRG